MNANERKRRILFEEEAAGVERLTEKDFRSSELPLARIKKIMKIEDEVEHTMGYRRCMVASEAPLLFAKACEVFIMEVTERAWDLTIGNKRRTLQRADIIKAVKSSDSFDFLIDIVPQDNDTIQKSLPLPKDQKSNDDEDEEEDHEEFRKRLLEHLKKQQALAHSTHPNQTIENKSEDDDRDRNEDSKSHP